MNEREMFEKGCFLPSWAEDMTEEQMPISTVYARHNKDLQTLLQELDDIKDRIQEIQAKVLTIISVSILTRMARVTTLRCVLLFILQRLVSSWRCLPMSLACSATQVISRVSAMNLISSTRVVSTP